MSNLFVSFEVLSAGYNVGNTAQIKVDGTVVNMPAGYGRGLNVAVVDESSGALLRKEVYDTYADSANADAFSDLIEQTPIGRLVAIAVKDDATASLTDRARRACQMIGSGLIRNLAYQGSWAIVGRRGAAPGAAAEQFSNSSAATVRAQAQIQPVDTDGLQISAYSAGYSAGNAASISIQGARILFNDGYARGLNVAVMDGATAAVLETSTYDTYASSAAADDFAALIEGSDPGRVVAIAVKDDAANSLTERAKKACESLGSALIRSLGYRGSWAMVGFKGAVRGSVAESVSASAPVNCAYWDFPDAPESRQGFSFALKSAGYSFGNSASLVVGGIPVEAFGPETDSAARGLNVAVVSETTGNVLEFHNYDTYESGADADAFAALVERMPVGRLVAVAAMDDAANSLTERGRRACEMIGSGLVRNLAYRGSWAIIGRKGCAPGSVPEVLMNNGAAGVEAWFATDGPRVIRPFVLVRADSAGYSVGNHALIEVTPNPALVHFTSGYGRGLNVAVLNEQDGSVTFARTYDTYNSGADADAFAAMVEALTPGRVVAIAAKDDAATSLTERAKKACESLGSGSIRSLAHRGSWAFVGKKGATPAAVAEMMSNNSPASSCYWLFPDKIFTGGGFNVSAKSAGYFVGNSAQLVSKGAVVKIPGGYGRGLNVAVIDETDGSVMWAGCYDTNADTGAADRFAELIESQPPGRMVAIAVKDEATNAMSERGRRACEMIGSGLIRNLAYRGSWALIGVKGTPPGSALEQLDNGAPTSVSIWVPFPEKEAAPAASISPTLTGALVFGALAVAVFGYYALRTKKPIDPLPSPTPPPMPTGRRYDQYTFLTAHNAMANSSDGWSGLFAQQYGDVASQLLYGARALALDVYVYNPGTGSDLYLCHRNCTSLGMPSPPRLFSATLAEVVYFLRANPREIVTILIESQDGWLPDQASNELFFSAFHTSGALELIFWPDRRNANPPSGVSTWEVNPADGVFNWPTLDAMIKADQRLLLFVDRNRGTPRTLYHIVPFVWRYMRETQFSDQGFWASWTPDCRERDQSENVRQANRSVLNWDHFPWLSGINFYAPHWAINSYNRLLARAQHCTREFGRVPNFVQLDFITEGGGRRLVNDINDIVWAANDPIAELNALPMDKYKDEL